LHVTPAEPGRGVVAGNDQNPHLVSPAVASILVARDQFQDTINVWFRRDFSWSHASLACQHLNLMSALGQPPRAITAELLIFVNLKRRVVVAEK
jgi:hypothetical protein